MPKTKTPAPGHTENQTTQQVTDAARIFGVTIERRNVMAAENPRGRMVRCGTPGESDYTFTVPAGPNRGRHVYLELKRGGFDPRKLRGPKREHWQRQLDYMTRRNADGDLALWVDSGEAFTTFYQRVLDWPGLRVAFDADGFPWMLTEDEP